MHQEDNKVEPVAYIVHESAMAREERKEKHLVTALILAVLLIFASNALAMLYGCGRGRAMNLRRHENGCKRLSKNIEFLRVSGIDL